jgi:ubiquinone biosynthesis protein COQ4
MADGFRRDPRGARALAERPRLRLPPIEELREMPAGSLGRAFADYLARNRIDPADLPSRPSPDEHAFVMAHLYETHDLWHTVTGFETDVAGELGLQAFYVAQTEGKLGLLLLSIGMLNSAGKGFDDRQPRLDAVARGWLLGKRARPLFGLSWSERWLQPIAELRAELGLDLDGVDRTVGASGDTVLRSAA